MFAWCADDIKQFDRSRYNQELATLPPDVRYTAKFEVGMLMRKAKRIEAEIAKDPKLAKIAIEMPRRLGDDWRAFAKANRSLVDHVRSIELAWTDNHEGTEDCFKTIAPEWKKAVDATPVTKDLAPSQSVAQVSRFNYLAAVGESRCAAGLDKMFEGFSRELNESIARAPMQRGPRTEAFETAVTTLSKGARDPINTPRMEAEDLKFLPLAQVNGHSPRFAAHTVATVEKHGDKMKFKFKKEKSDYAVCTREEPSGNWIIEGNRLVREIHCVSFKAESMMEDVTPIEVPIDFMPWVKPGYAVVLGAAEVPMEIWSDVHQTKLIGLYGTQR